VKVVLDASVVIAFLERTDALHADAVSLLERLVDDEFVLHPLTYAEILVGAVRADSVDTIVSVLDALEVEVFPLDRDGAQALASARARSGLKMPDACVLSLATDLGSPLATFDDRLARAAKSAGVDVLAT
jgi:predicted nucleic acid-binding protein